jgi:uncharacterized protein (TIGR03435 family)
MHTRPHQFYSLSRDASRSLDRPVVDRTGLSDRYDIQLRTDTEPQTDDFGRTSLQGRNVTKRF